MRIAKSLCRSYLCTQVTRSTKQPIEVVLWLRSQVSPADRDFFAEKSCNDNNSHSAASKGRGDVQRKQRRQHPAPPCRRVVALAGRCSVRVLAAEDGTSRCSTSACRHKVLISSPARRLPLYSLLPMSFLSHAKRDRKERLQLPHRQRLLPPPPPVPHVRRCDRSCASVDS